MNELGDLSPKRLFEDKEMENPHVMIANKPERIDQYIDSKSPVAQSKSQNETSTLGFIPVNKRQGNVPAAAVDQIR